MNDKIDRIETERKKILKIIENINTMEDIKSIKNNFFGDKSFFALSIKELPKYSKEEKKILGPILNKTLKELEKIIGEKKQKLLEQVENFDLSLPLLKTTGFLHPISITKNLVETILLSEGIEKFDSPEIETEENNFTLLNIDEKHPTRDDHQSFFLNIDNREEKMLRTQTTAGWPELLKQYRKDCKLYSLGKTYRRDSDKTHSPMFHQVEVLMIGKHCNFKNLVKFIRRFLNRFFEKKIDIRLRPNHFPFTHLSIEVDILWNNKWLEILGAGIIHHNIFKNLNQEPRLGFALGCGIERLHMIKYEVNDLREFYSYNVKNIEKNGRKSFEI